jgi:hypothetical protein
MCGRRPAVAWSHFFVLPRNNHRADALSLWPTRSRTRVGSERAPTRTRGALSISAMAQYKPPRSKILGQGCYAGSNLTGMSVPANAISARPSIRRQRSIHLVNVETSDIACCAVRRSRGDPV